MSTTPSIGSTTPRPIHPAVTAALSHPWPVVDDDGLHAFCDDVAQQLLGADPDLVGVMVVDVGPDGAVALASAGPGAEVVCTHALASGWCPIVDAIRAGEPQRTAAAELPGSRPGWDDVLADARADGVAITPYRSRDVVGGLVVLSRRGEVGDATADAADVVAGLVHLAVERCRREQQVSDGYDARTLVGIAVGRLMARYDLDADAALAYLKRLSSQRNRKVRDLAADLIAGLDPAG